MYVYVASSELLDDYCIVYKNVRVAFAKKTKTKGKAQKRSKKGIWKNVKPNSSIYHSCALPCEKARYIETWDESLGFSIAFVGY